MTPIYTVTEKILLSKTLYNILLLCIISKSNFIIQSNVSCKFQSIILSTSLPETLSSSHIFSTTATVLHAHTNVLFTSFVISQLATSYTITFKMLPSHSLPPETPLPKPLPINMFQTTSNIMPIFGMNDVILVTKKKLLSSFLLFSNFIFLFFLVLNKI